MSWGSDIEHFTYCDEANTSPTILQRNGPCNISHENEQCYLLEIYF